MNRTDIYLIFLDKMILYLSIVPFIAFPFVFVNFYRYMKDYSDRKEKGEYVSQWQNLPYKSILAFIGPIMLIFLLSDIMSNTVRKNVLIYLSHATADITVMVDGNLVSDSSTLILELRKLRTYFAHHSHPEKHINIAINDRGSTLELTLGRDSGLPNEYWVFYPRYRATSKKEIGRITTNFFDSYR